MVLEQPGLGGGRDHRGISRVLSESLWDQMMGKQDRLQISGRLLSRKTIASAKVVHKGSEGLLTLRFSDGTVKVYGYNDLGFWEEDFGGKEVKPCRP